MSGSNKRSRDSLVRDELLKSDLIHDAASSAAIGSRGLLDAVLFEANHVEPWIDDYADTELSMRSVQSLVHFDGPEISGKRAADPQGVSKVVCSPEALMALTKATELFILDLALKTWQSKEFQTDETKRVCTQIHSEDLRMAVRMNENFDFLEMAAAEPLGVLRNEVASPPGGINN
jgi:hypothetical protein